MSQDQTTLGDSEIREALRAYVKEQWSHFPGTQVIEELGLCRGQVRIDLAVVNGVLHGYEIKSDKDQLTRLAAQAEMYGRVVDRATIAVGPRYLDAALRRVPSWWGVLLVDRGDQDVHCGTIRPPAENPGQDPRALVELLWRDEALTLLESRQAASGVRGKPRAIIWDRVCEHFEVDEIAAAVRDRLKLRAGRSTAVPHLEIPR